MDQEYYEDADYVEYNEGEEGEEIEIEAIGVEVSAQPIELYKVFKIANLVSGGGEAKHVISEGYVAVNGELETRKRRKMYDGDFFEFNQEYYVVVCDVPVQEPQEKPVKAEPKASKKPAKNKNSSNKKNKSSNSSRPELSASAKPKKQKEKSQAAKQDNKLKPQRDEKSGRNSIDFF
ncbi:RNA-binding S4 domain-containing protein [Vibrio sp. T187]|uniref:RNA-binding S4 domain-containing protein n=1 Tax=Vibrio TaxID=662 RepID=UPI0010CA0013|nr:MULTISPECIES: RNA-binding S4 domain-containing protein [Vibrio]MBW3696185.1 RNA-binding S4 domain-containing protein [Vibrio sp. T187]